MLQLCSNNIALYLRYIYKDVSFLSSWLRTRKETQDAVSMESIQTTLRSQQRVHNQSFCHHSKGTAPTRSSQSRTEICDRSLPQQISGKAWLVRIDRLSTDPETTRELHRVHDSTRPATEIDGPANGDRARTRHDPTRVDPARTRMQTAQANELYEDPNSLNEKD
jgi:hypothetical protein